MTRREVKSLMLLKGVTFSQIAQELSVTSQTVYEVMANKMHSRRTESALEKALGVPISELRLAWNNHDLPSDETVNSALKRFSLGLPA